MNQTESDIKRISISKSESHPRPPVISLRKPLVAITLRLTKKGIGWGSRTTMAAVVLLGVMVAGWTQDANAQAQQDPVAIATIQTALNSMGGAPAFGAIQDVTVSAQTMDGNGLPISPQITWESIGVAIRSQVTTQAGTTIYTAQNGVGFEEGPSGSVSAMDTRTANSMFPPDMPGVTLNYILNTANCSLTVISDSGASPSVIHIQAVMLASDQTPITETQQDWYVDTTTGLPTQVNYVIPSTSGPDQTGNIQFTSWQKTSTVLVPQTIQLSQSGGSPTTIVLATPSFNQGLSTSIFQLP